VKPIEAKFIQHPDEYQKTAGHTDRKPGDINQGEGLIFQEIPESYFYIVK
jgi:hypothetical protein